MSNNWQSTLLEIALIVHCTIWMNLRKDVSNIREVLSQWELESDIYDWNWYMLYFSHLFMFIVCYRINHAGVRLSITCLLCVHGEWIKSLTFNCHTNGRHWIHTQESGHFEKSYKLIPCHTKLLSSSCTEIKNYLYYMYVLYFIIRIMLYVPMVT